MAKLKAPLLSLGASGAIGRSIVFFPWKGLDCAREYVVPANPNTAAQQTQRGYLKAAVDKIHEVQALATDPLDQEDIAAYALWGSCEPTPRTWFNTIVRMWLDGEAASIIPVIYSNGTISNKSRIAFACVVTLNEKTASSLVAGKFYFGTSKTALIHAVAATIVPGVSAALTAEDISAFVTAGQKYFIQFRPDAADPCEGARSGIYYFVAEA